MTWLFDNFHYVWSLTLRHMWLSALPIAIGFVIALPIGWYASSHKWTGGGLLSLSSILYTIPSLPMLVILPGLLGTGFLSPINVVVSLSIYAVAIMVRSSSDAFGSVSPAVLDAASAAGFSPIQRALRVQLPLAGPVLLAGLRVVSVSTVSLVSVATIVGVSNLGSLFTDGLRRSFNTEIVIGVAATVIVAMFFDLVLVLAGKLLLPWASADRPVRARSPLTPMAEFFTRFGAGGV